MGLTKRPLILKFNFDNLIKIKLYIFKNNQNYLLEQSITIVRTWSFGEIRGLTMIPNLLTLYFIPKTQTFCVYYQNTKSQQITILEVFIVLF